MNIDALMKNRYSSFVQGSANGDARYVGLDRCVMDSQ